VFDLVAAVAARADRRSGAPASARLYAARQPVDRDVAALFLFDLSASTDARIRQDGEANSPTDLVMDKDAVRVIDILKESMVMLSSALEEIGDAYAIYGFSSAGRENVEVYPVKLFNEALTQEVRGRISALEPKRSTRMGAAVRHATRRLRDVSSRAKLLILLSDGCPEDAMYGPEKVGRTYGLRDTMMALQEAERHNVASFCLTVDKSGHDYLREMCPPSRYMVIENISSLPVELPKVYQRHVQARFFA
jgi:nitric oxide reductase activation protein